MMLQSILLGLLLVEAAFYVWLCRVLLERGVADVAVAAIILFIAIVWRLSHALASFSIASMLRWRDGRVLPWGNSMAALANEFAARFVCFNWSQPFAGLAMGAEPNEVRNVYGSLPILLVHGYGCNSGLWITFRKRLIAAGLGPVYTLTMEPLFGGVDVLVAKLDVRIEAICGQTGATQVMIVAHSMGGLVTRAYMSRARTQPSTVNRVSKFVSLGAPHQGTQMARLGIGINANQMQGGEWLEKLGASEAAELKRDGGHRLPTALSIYTLNDDLVYPPESSVLAWAENVPVSAVGHMGLVFSEPIARRVIAWLR